MAAQKLYFAGFHVIAQKLVPVFAVGSSVCLDENGFSFFIKTRADDSFHALSHFDRPGIAKIILAFFHIQNNQLVFESGHGEHLVAVDEKRIPSVF